MPIQLSAEQRRVLGCLLEKAVVTPDQYPLTLNALVNACNQKSSRNPVMQLESGQVLRALNQLKEQRIVVEDENFKSRVQKFSQRFCGTPFSDYQFDPAQYAVVCLLLLRGAQTPGELRSRSGRLYSFTNNEEVRATLANLIEWEGGPLVVRLPRQTGRQDHEYTHLFTDEQVEQSVPDTNEASAAESAVVGAGQSGPSMPRTQANDRAGAAMADQLAALEARVARLETLLGETDGRND